MAILRGFEMELELMYDKYKWVPVTSYCGTSTSSSSIRYWPMYEYVLSPEPKQINLYRQTVRWTGGKVVVDNFNCEPERDPSGFIAGY